MTARFGYIITLQSKTMIKRKDDFVKGIANRGKASAVGDRKAGWV